MILSVTLLPLGALLGSWTVFSTLGFWVAFMPLVACVLADQIMDHLRRYGALTRRLQLLEEEHERLTSAARPSVEPEPAAETDAQEAPAVLPEPDQEGPG
jgi:hypothetical protein